MMDVVVLLPLFELIAVVLQFDKLLLTQPLLKKSAESLQRVSSESVKVEINEVEFISISGTKLAA